MSCPALTTWLFGKIPSLGDFVSRGIDTAMRDRIDAWLSREMELARAAHGEAFASRYDTAPAWTFVDVDDSGNWSGGALCASQDRAGRRFPLIVGTPAAGPADAAGRSAGCLSVIYSAFGDGWDAAAIAAAEVAAEPVPGWRPDGPQWALLAQDGPVAVLEGHFPEGVVSGMMEWSQ